VKQKEKSALQQKNINCCNPYPELILNTGVIIDQQINSGNQ
jgi:hypothetical protein